MVVPRGPSSRRAASHTLAHWRAALSCALAGPRGSREAHGQHQARRAGAGGRPRAEAASAQAGPQARRPLATASAFSGSSSSRRRGRGGSTRRRAGRRVPTPGGAARPARPLSPRQHRHASRSTAATRHHPAASPKRRAGACARGRRSRGAASHRAPHRSGVAAGLANVAVALAAPLPPPSFQLPAPGGGGQRPGRGRGGGGGAGRRAGLGDHGGGRAVRAAAAAGAGAGARARARRVGAAAGALRGRLGQCRRG